MKVAFIFLCAAIGLVGAYYAHPYAKDNADLVLVVGTVFTVFAGFLVAIITILGDPTLVPGDDWKLVEVRRNRIERRIIQHVWLLMAYLVTIAILFVSVVLEKVPKELVSDKIKETIDFVYLFVGITSFCLSFALPFALLSGQMSRLDEETERRRAKQGIR